MGRPRRAVGCASDPRDGFKHVLGAMGGVNATGPLDAAPVGTISVLGEREPNSSCLRKGDLPSSQSWAGTEPQAPLSPALRKLTLTLTPRPGSALLCPDFRSVTGDANRPRVYTFAVSDLIGNQQFMFQQLLPTLRDLHPGIKKQLLWPSMT